MTTYYVSTSGNDTNPGTEASPWLTINKAAHTMQPGDTTYVRGGTYVEGVDFWYAGTSGSLIKLMAYPAETPIIDATGHTAGIIPLSYTELNGLEIKNATNDGINIWTQVGVRIIDCHIHHNGWNGIGAAGTGCSYLYISGCDCSYNGQAGVSSGGGGCGINLYVTGDFSVVDDCDLHHNGITNGQWAAGIEFQGDYVTVTNCRVYNNKLCGINPCSTYGSVVGYCQIYDNYNNGIHMDAGTASTIIHHCTIYRNVTGGGWGAGITIATNCGSNNEILNNTIYSNTPGVGEAESAGIQFIGTTSHGNIVKNNITMSNTRRALYVYDADTLAAEDYNDWMELSQSKTIYFGGTEYSALATYRSASGFSAHSITADPTFTDAASGDFSLVAGSPCIDTGTDTGHGYTYTGAAPDMGAHEGTGIIIPPEVEEARLGEAPISLVVPAGYTIAVMTDGTWGVLKVGAGGGVGVTSVGLALPAQFTVTGSPVTASGTLTGAWATQTANYIFAGPASGAAAAPTFRALVSADFPDTVQIDYQLGVGTAPSEALSVYGALNGANFPYNATFQDSASLAAGIGGGIGFQATDGVNVRSFAAMRGAKVNSTSGQYGVNLEFYTRTDGGNLTKWATLKDTGELALLGNFSLVGRDIKPNVTLSAFTDDVTDLDPGTYAVHYRMSSSKAVIVHGLKAGSDGEVCTLSNVGAHNITFANQSGTCTTAADRFLLASGDIVLLPNDRINLLRDGTTGRWRA